MPLYERTMSFILQYVDEQELEEGDKIPTESTLSSMAGVSMVTVRRALAELASQGIVRREQGRGTFLNRPRINAETTRLGGLRNGLALDATSALETRLLGLTRRDASDQEATRLKLAPKGSVWEICRLRLLNERPMIHEMSVVPVILAPDLGACYEQNPQRPLYASLEEVYGLREVREEQSLVCRRAKRADVELLHIPKSDWVVEISGMSFSASNIPIDAFRMVFDAQGFAFRLSNAPASIFSAVELNR